MTLTADPTVDRMQRRIQAPDYDSWRAKVAATGGCAQPVRLSGAWALQDAHTGETLRSTSGQIFAPCGNRRASVCPTCSDRYAADAFHLLRAGLAGGTKNVPDTVADQPRMFLTLTAPSFGPVHNHRTSTKGRLLPCRCGAHHTDADHQRGQPLDPERYDYTGHVLWQAHAGPLWHAFRQRLVRELAKAAGIRIRAFGDHARLSYAKVAEYQRRGLIHFHAVIRLDGPNGPDDTPPTWASPELLSAAIRAAHQTTRVTAPDIDGHARELTWGSQIDIRPITAANASQVENEHGEITDDRLASYVAKYATKGTSTSEATDRPIRSQGHIDQLQINPHHRRIIHTAWNLGARDDLAHLNLRRWAHMLAFRGHFLTKSRRYSVTFKRIRGDRRQYRHDQVLAELGITDEASITVINHWEMTSVGHNTAEEAELAHAIAEQHHHARKHRYATERKD